MESLPFIEPGMSVMICRSDGRTHAATVKDMDETKMVVNVEWHEGGGSKGKEIAISDILDLNPHLLEKPTHVPPQAMEVAQRNYRGRLRSSRMQPPSASVTQAGPSEEPGAKRCTSNFSAAGYRQSTAYSTAPPTDLPHEPTRSAIPRPSALPTRTPRRKPQLPMVEAVCESEESRCASSTSAARRISISQNVAPGNKRLSVMPKDVQGKKSRVAEVSRPNKKFYDMIEEYRETVEKIPLPISGHVENPRICVCVRKRPLSKREVTKKEIDVVTVPGNGMLLFHEPKQKVDLTKYLENQVFHFDYSFDEDTTNETVYKFTAKPLVRTTFEGGMATCFAYGQTGSGKTHTMGGDFSGKNQNSSKGIYALAAQDIFTLLKQQPDIDPYVSFFEIYNGKVLDLLNKKCQLRVLEDEHQQVQVVGLQEVSVSCVGDVIKMIEKGSACRTSGQTFANANSSRSHAILQIILRRRLQLHGKFSLVDLAGNERGTDVQSSDRQTLVETAEINRSLLALKECIRSLGQNSDHIPFRMSKLTQVLRDSFIGEKSRTCMIAMISPGMTSCNYTLNTLRYADRVKELNGTSKAVQDASIQSGLSESSEDSIDPLFEAINQVTEMEEKLREEMLAGRNLCQSFVSQSFEVANSLPEIKDFLQRSLDAVKELEKAIKEEQDLRSMST